MKALWLGKLCTLSRTCYFIKPFIFAALIWSPTVIYLLNWPFPSTGPWQHRWLTNNQIECSHSHNHTFVLSIFSRWMYLSSVRESHTFKFQHTKQNVNEIRKMTKYTASWHLLFQQRTQWTIWTHILEVWKTLKCFFTVFYCTNFSFTYWQRQKFWERSMITTNNTFFHRNFLFKENC